MPPEPEATADDVRASIVPKSDQMNADDLLARPITVRVLAVRAGSKEQPIVISVDGGRQPYKPCKSMRRVLVAAWGDEAKTWVGRSMTLYCDPDVVFGGVRVGGIRISHLSHLDTALALPLTVTKGKRTPYRVEPLRTLDDVLRAQGATIEDADGWCRSKSRPALSTADEDTRTKAAAFFAAHPEALRKPAAPQTSQQGD